jgi:hypothetical protein
MSLFQPVNLACPACAELVAFSAVASVNADRRPDLRDAIIDGSFQREACGKCGKTFRLDPEMMYLDIGRSEWIAVFPVARLPEWEAVEQQARNTFDLAFGAKASTAAAEVGAGLKPRLVFGWSALREKIVAAENGLDDVTLELLKAAMLRNVDEMPISPDNELRFIEMEGEELVLAWLRSADEELLEAMNVPRELYDDIVADAEAWQPLRDELTKGIFIDLQRMTTVPAAH